MSQFDEMSRLNVVLDRIKNLARDDDDFRELFIEDLNVMLNEYQGGDVFGTEGQNDPRGDQRNGLFTVFNVEGYDT